jgi:hypothetical protein
MPTVRRSPRRDPGSRCAEGVHRFARVTGCRDRRSGHSVQSKSVQSRCRNSSPRAGWNRLAMTNCPRRKYGLVLRSAEALSPAPPQEMSGRRFPQPPVALHPSLLSAGGVNVAAGGPGISRGGRRMQRHPIILLPRQACAAERAW